MRFMFAKMNNVTLENTCMKEVLGEQNGCVSYKVGIEIEASTDSDELQTALTTEYNLLSDDEDESGECVDIDDQDCKTEGSGSINPQSEQLSLESRTVQGSWSEFGPWSLCSVSCGEGVRQRSRECQSDPGISVRTNCDG